MWQLCREKTTVYQRRLLAVTFIRISCCPSHYVIGHLQITTDFLRHLPQIGSHCFLNPTQLRLLLKQEKLKSPVLNECKLPYFVYCDTCRNEQPLWLWKYLFQTILWLRLDSEFLVRLWVHLHNQRGRNFSTTCPDQCWCQCYTLEWTQQAGWLQLKL